MKLIQTKPNKIESFISSQLRVAIKIRSCQSDMSGSYCVGLSELLQGRQVACGYSSALPVSLHLAARNNDTRTAASAATLGHEVTLRIEGTLWGWWSRKRERKLYWWRQGANYHTWTVYFWNAFIWKNEFCCELNHYYFWMFLCMHLILVLIYKQI